MMKKRLPLIAWALLASVAMASGQNPSCPAEITVEQKATPPDPQWKPFDSQPRHPFLSVAFSEGDPSGRAILAPTRQQKTKQRQADIWLFPESSLGYWLLCEYSGTSMTLSRPLDAGVKSCEAEYDPRFSSAVVKQLTCK
jgi:hypothetical protein